MHIEALEVRDVRNLKSVRARFSPRTVVLRGLNAQGKTNLLEVLYLCATGRSFRHAKPSQLLRHGAATGHVAATFVRQGVRHDVEVKIEGHRRSMRVDGRGLRQVVKLLELINVVAFFPDDLRIAKGAPEERRRFLDRAIANHRSDFVAASLAYQRALKSRNALLRAPTAPERAMVAAYDAQLIEHGKVMHNCREQTLEELTAIGRKHFAFLMQMPLDLDVRLVSGVSQSETSDFPTAFSRALAESLPRDLARGTTSVGPHRADLHLAVGGQEARHFASQGQQRAIVLALKLAEVDYLGQALECAPILLLDDVSSELDAVRTRMLFARVAELESQVWVTTTGATALPLPDHSQLIEVQDGEINEVFNGPEDSLGAG